MISRPLESIRSLAAQFSPGMDVTLGEAEAFIQVAERLRTAPKDGIQPCSLHESELLTLLMFATTDYCYFTGRAAVYPAGGGSSVMEEITEKAVLRSDGDRQKAVEYACEMVVQSRLPEAESRIRHLREIASVAEHKFVDLTALVFGQTDAESVIGKMLVCFPGFAGDPYLKRALLFFHKLHQTHGFYEKEEIAALPIPADYQIPKVLRSLGLLRYSERLDAMVENAEPVTKHSRLEHEIRANAIVAAQRLADISGLTVSDVDHLLWGMRKQVLTPHHITITTDY